MALQTAQPAKRRRAESLAPYVFAAGAAIYLLLFTAGPLLNGVWLSFTDAKLLDPTAGEFIGAENYANLFANPRFYDSLLVTVIYSLATVLGSLVIGTLGAVMLNHAFRGRSLARAVLTFPWAAPTVAVSLIFVWIFNNDSGVLNHLTEKAGLGRHGWLTDPSLALATVTAVSVWKVFPFVLLVVLAALQNVPRDLYESAYVDGADALTIFRKIVLPFLVPTLRVVALLMTIWSFRRFEIIWLLTQGGPVDSTNTLVINVYRESFLNSELGVSAATGAIGLILSGIVTGVYAVIERRATAKEEYA
ncbi:MAG TPA: sugar ABC transporter permease [Micromonosporaceae bacterium]|nr:sugar ABC transporter permease [Micromonosporaceae bacterium]